MIEEESTPEKNIAEQGVRRVPILIAVHAESKFGKNGYFEVTATVMRALQVDYPSLDIRAQVAKMILYWESNTSGRWKLPMSGMRNWLDKEAGRKRGRQRTFSKANKAQTDMWWRTDAGWISKGKEVGEFQREDELFGYFKARVCVAIARDGPWVDERNATFMRILSEVRDRQPGAVH